MISEAMEASGIEHPGQALQRGDPAQAAVFTPCDFAFPTNGIKAEATPNTEMTLIADIDINPLLELHNFGSVRNLKDRRKDFYELKIINKNG